MRSVSLSKYLSKSVHFFTAFVYLFTFLGPSLALATSTITYTETVQEEQVVQTQSFLPKPAITTVFTGTGRTVGESFPTLQEESRQRDQNEKHINISRGWGNQSLYFGIGQTIQHLVSPLTLSQGNLPYEEVLEEGYSLGFQGEIPGLGHFLCCWDGELLLQGSRTKSSGDLALEEEPPLSLEEARLLLKPYLNKEGDCVEGEEWGGYSAPLIGAPLNETFKSVLVKRVNDAWYALEKRLKGAFIPLVKSLGLDEKAFWDLKDYITVVSKSAAFLRQYQATDENSTVNLDVIKAHLSTSTLDAFAPSFLVLQDEMAEELLTLWTLLARQIGDEFTAQAERSDLNEFTFASFQTLASFANDLLDHINETSQERTLYVEGKNTLVLETFAPVTFSNFIAKAVKTTAKRIFFRG